MSFSRFLYASSAVFVLGSSTLAQLFLCWVTFPSFFASFYPTRNVFFGYFFSVLCPFASEPSCLRPHPRCLKDRCIYPYPVRRFLLQLSSLLMAAQRITHVSLHSHEPSSICNLAFCRSQFVPTCKLYAWLTLARTLESTSELAKVALYSLTNTFGKSGENWQDGFIMHDTSTLSFCMRGP